MHAELIEHFQEQRMPHLAVLHVHQHSLALSPFCLLAQCSLLTIVDSAKLKRHVSRSLLTAVLSHTVMASRAVIASEVSPLRSLSQRFNPVTPVLPQHVVVTSGVGPALELCGFAFCDPGRWHTPWKALLRQSAQRLRGYRAK